MEAIWDSFQLKKPKHIQLQCGKEKANFVLVKLVSREEHKTALQYLSVPPKIPF